MRLTVRRVIEQHCTRQRYRTAATILTVLAVSLARFFWIQVEFFAPPKTATRLDNKCRSRQRPALFNSSSSLGGGDDDDDDDGAVILFYHIAKTGGTTIRRAFAGTTSHVKYVLAKGVPHRQVGAFLERQKHRGMRQSGSHGSKRRMVLFIEFHGISPGLSELSKWMPIWRSQCEEQNLRFFAFTLLRDPVALHISAFTFFHHRDDDDPMTKTSSTNTPSKQEQLLLQTALPNRQCRVLHHGQGRKQRAPHLHSAVTPAQCHSVQHHLCRDWDWVGTTEQLSASTLPALVSLVHGASSSTAPSSPLLATTTTASSIAPANVQNRTVTVSHEVRQRLQDLSALDWELYRFFQQEIA